MDEHNYIFRRQTGGALFVQGNDLIDQMARLYSSHYGCWGQSHSKAGESIKMTATTLKDWVSSDNTNIVLAKYDDELIGYAIYVQAKTKPGTVSWVIQFVVHEEHRSKDVGKALLFSIWNFSDHFAWGLLTANPRAVRALEKATRRRCNPDRIKISKNELVSFGSKHVPYFDKKLKLLINESFSKVNTKFLLDHSDLAERIKETVEYKNIPWVMGDLDEGWEWFAFTFKDEAQLKLTAEEINMMLSASDDVVQQAYSRMLLDNPTQAWQKFAPEECEFIVNACGLKKGDAVLDLGCAQGRHCLHLAEKYHADTHGVDYIPDFVDKARSLAKEKQLQSEFSVGDCRFVNLDRQFDVVICLYDVIGTYSDNAMNQRIVDNIALHTKPNGYAVISVMNYELTIRIAKHIFRFEDQPDAMLDLEASNTMEATGNIFNPNYYLVDDKTRIVYRKEQFMRGEQINEELIVRDRRFTKEEIEDMCKRSGLTPFHTEFVHVGSWDVPDQRDSENAKEILLICKKIPSSSDEDIPQTVDRFQYELPL